jgi:hypothetical protein
MLSSILKTAVRFIPKKASNIELLLNIYLQTSNKICSQTNKLQLYINIYIYIHTHTHVLQFTQRTTGTALKHSLWLHRSHTPKVSTLPKAVALCSFEADYRPAHSTAMLDSKNLHSKIQSGDEFKVTNVGHVSSHSKGF